MLSTYYYGDALLIKKSFNIYATNDFIYFEYPVKDSSLPKTFVVQRLIGLPGDSIRLNDKNIFINGTRIEIPATIQNNYFVTIKNREADSLFHLKYHFEEGGQVSNDYDYSFSLTRAQSDSLGKDTLVKKAEVKKEKPDNYDETCFPGSPHYKWNMDHYGPIYIPRKHDTLRIDSVSLALYTLLIRVYEGNKLETRHDSILINDQITNNYVVKQNYYFVVGDNRDNANDSRVWGFLPERCIKGKVITRIRKSKP